MSGRAMRVCAALAVAGGGAVVATLLLEPRAGVVTPAAIDPAAYFSPEQIRRAEAFRGPQRALSVAGTILSGVALALVALRPPRAWRRLLGAAAARPLLGAAATGAGLSVLLAVLGLPLDALAEQRSVAAGLSTQSFAAWLADTAITTAIGGALAGLGAVLALALVRRFPRRWWAPGSLVVVLLGGVFLTVGPVVLDPIFNQFTPLPSGPLRSEVLGLADRAGVRVGEVYGVDASRRTTGTNAYVGGLGPTKRVVLYDTLIEGFPPDQVRSVVAHELSHQRHADLWRGLAWLAIVAPGGMFLVQTLTEAAHRRPQGSERGATGPALVPALALATALVTFGLSVASNVLSRRVEARADTFALELTRAPRSFIGLQQRLAVSNRSDPDPPAWFQLVFGTHPTARERIGTGVAYARRG